MKYINIRLFDNGELKKFIKFLLKILISLILIIFIGFLILEINEPSEKTLIRKYSKEIKKDVLIEELIYFKRGFEGKNNEVIIKLYDGKIIGGFVSKKSIYDFKNINIIGNYRINILRYIEYYENNLQNKNIIVYFSGIENYLLEYIIFKSENYFNNDLNNFIKYYEEILEFIKTIYNEGEIPGRIETNNTKDFSIWGDEEELKNYIGYIIYEGNTAISRVKIYVNIND